MLGQSDGLQEVTPARLDDRCRLFCAQMRLPFVAPLPEKPYRCLGALRRSGAARDLWYWPDP